MKKKQENRMLLIDEKNKLNISLKEMCLENNFYYYESMIFSIYSSLHDYSDIIFSFVLAHIVWFLSSSWHLLTPLVSIKIWMLEHFEICNFWIIRSLYVRKGLVLYALMETHLPEIGSLLYCPSNHQLRFLSSLSRLRFSYLIMLPSFCHPFGCLLVLNVV